MHTIRLTFLAFSQSCIPVSCHLTGDRLDRLYCTAAFGCPTNKINIALLRMCDTNAVRIANEFKNTKYMLRETYLKEIRIPLHS